MHERKIMLTFFLSFLNHMPFWIPRLFGYICTKRVCSWGNGDNDGSKGVSISGLNCSFFIMEQVRANLGPFSAFPWPGIGTKGATGCNRKERNVVGAQRSAATLFTTQCQPEHALTAVLNLTDNRLLHIRPSQQLLHDSRHTLLHWAEEWVWIEASTS